MQLKLIREAIRTTIYKNIDLKNLQFINVCYNHAEHNFILKLAQNREIFKQKDNFPVVEVKLDKATFMKTVLENNKLHEFPEITRRRVVIDFSSPNIAKPFHAGHLRSTVIGNFIANLNSYFHNEVTKLNYLGDWGTQFGLLQYGLQLKNIKIEDEPSPIKTLYDIYVNVNKLASADENIQTEARTLFANIEQGKGNLDNWKILRKVTVQELEKVYQRLGIKFDVYQWESDYNGKAIRHIIKLLEEKDIIKVDESGRKLAKVKNRDVTLLKSDKSTLYLTRDIAALIDRHHTFNFDDMLYVVDNSQRDHFSAVFDIAKQVNPEYVKGCKHIDFGRVKGMSTRSGNVVFLNDILDEAKQKMFEKQQLSKNTRRSAMNEETCDILGTTAVVINDLKQKRQKDYLFDWDRTLHSEGDSGIKLQYLHCRLWSLEQNTQVGIPDLCDPSYLKENIVCEVVSELFKFENVLKRSLMENEACLLVNYLFKLARHVNRMFNELNVKNVESDLAAQRLLVFHKARQTVKTGLEILGLKVLNKM